jgi:hypothetical protein
MCYGPKMYSRVQMLLTEKSARFGNSITDHVPSSETLPLHLFCIVTENQPAGSFNNYLTNVEVNVWSLVCPGLSG